MLVVVTFRLALRAIDFLFVLHMKNVTGSLFSGTNSKEMIALIKAYSSKKPWKSGGTEHASELDDAEAGRAGKAGCFGKRREYVYKVSEEVFLWTPGSPNLIIQGPILGPQNRSFVNWCPRESMLGLADLTLLSRLNLPKLALSA